MNQIELALAYAAKTGTRVLLGKRELFHTGILSAVAEFDRRRDLGKGVLQTHTLTAAEILADSPDLRVLHTRSSSFSVTSRSKPPSDTSGCKQRIRSAVNDRIGIEPKS